MAPRFIDDPLHWRHRAAEARALADNMHDEVSRQMMLRIAEDYDRLAERAQTRNGTPNPPGYGD
jgi:hypothetical protein